MKELQCLDKKWKTIDTYNLAVVGFRRIWNFHDGEFYIWKPNFVLVLLYH